MNLTDSVTARCSTSLTMDDAEDGIRALQENAARLARDAKLLLHARRYSAAAALATACLREIARTPTLLELAHARSERQIRHFWSKFHSASPEFPWSLFAANGSQVSDDDLNQMLSFIGMAGNNVCCLTQCVWTRPEQIISANLAKELVGLAESFARHPPDIQALRLWLDVVGSFPKNTHDSRIFECFKVRLRTEGFDRAADTVQTFHERAAERQPAE